MSVTVGTDLRDQLVAVRDQGPRPTCLVFASTAAHEVERCLHEPLSVEFLAFSGAARSHGDRKRGLKPSVVAEALKQDGQPIETAWPYSPTPSEDWSPPGPCEPRYRASVVFEKCSVKEIRELVDRGKPVLLLLVLTVAMYSPDEKAVVRPVPNDPTTGHHAVLAVGTGRDAGAKCILVRNSWGSGWGDHGYAWLHEAYVEAQLQSAGVITDKDASET